MADPTTELPFPYQADNQDSYSFESPAPQAQENDFFDAPQQTLPPHIMEQFQAIALQAKYAPCEIMAEAQDILAGLQEGSLEYLGINQENGFVELSSIEDGSLRELHGPHVAALVQYYGVEEIFDVEAFESGEPHSGVLFDALGKNEEAYEMSIGNLSGTMAVEAVEGLMPGTTDRVPGVPQVQSCFMS